LTFGNLFGRRERPQPERGAVGERPGSQRSAGAFQAGNRKHL
jgi:hypothetical protein